ncbi:MAG: hypothetical protein ACE5G7_02675 [Candidatus Hydrothermarchaeaceae archaeon]
MGIIVVVGIVMLVRSKARRDVTTGSMDELLVETEGEEMGVKKEPEGGVEDVFADERQKYEAKIQQLTNFLNVERDKLKAKEAQFQQQSKEFLKVAALKDEIAYLQKRIGKLEREKNATAARYEKEAKNWDEKFKDLTASVEEEKATYKEELDIRQKEMLKKHEDEIEEYKKEIEDLKAVHLTEKERLEKDYEKRFEDEKRRHREKIDELKDKTKEAIQKVAREKENIHEEIRDENERLKKDRERLKERIRLLEVEHL